MSTPGQKTLERQNKVQLETRKLLHACVDCLAEDEKKLINRNEPMHLYLMLKICLSKLGATFKNMNAPRNQFEANMAATEIKEQCKKLNFMCNSWDTSKINNCIGDNAFNGLLDELCSKLGGDDFLYEN